MKFILSSIVIASAFLWISFSPATSKRRLVAVTGATGSLGRSIVRQLLEHICDKNSKDIVYPICRTDDRAKQMFELEVAQGTLIGRGFITGSAIPGIADMKDLASVEAFVQSVDDANLLPIEDLVLINNAGVCIEGTSLSALDESLLVNCLGPAHLTELMIEKFSKRFLESTETGHNEKCALTIVNVSSGEGELVFLNSAVQDDLNRITTYQEWRSYVDQLLNPNDAQSGALDGSSNTALPNGSNTPFEYAFGPTPYYSLSKALLNVYTRITQARLSQSQSQLQSLSQSRGPLSRVRIVSVCPGNFQSVMSRPEEADDAIPVEDAAAHVLDVALGGPDRYPGGKFYRFGMEIPW